MHYTTSESHYQTKWEMKTVLSAKTSLETAHLEPTIAVCVKNLRKESKSFIDY